MISNTLTLRVRNPLDRTEEDIADLYSGHDQGTLFFLLGSDSESLASGNKAFENVIDRHGQHPLAVYAHLARGMNAGRSFKTIVAPLRLQDFRQLAPGEGFDPTEARDGASYLPLFAFANFTPEHAGRYELRLTLSTESEKAEDWLGMLGYPGEEEVIARLKQVPRLRVESNVAVVEVG